jgi:hypothetical protein
LGWTVGRLFGVGPWADSAADGGQVAGGNGNGTTDGNGTSDGNGTTDGNEAPDGSTTSSEPAGNDDATDGGRD